jgi:hypothetical protein
MGRRSAAGKITLSDGAHTFENDKPWLHRARASSTGELERLPATLIAHILRALLRAGVLVEGSLPEGLRQFNPSLEANGPLEQVSPGLAIYLLRMKDTCDVESVDGIEEWEERRRLLEVGEKLAERDRAPIFELDLDVGNLSVDDIPGVATPQRGGTHRGPCAEQRGDGEC